MMPRQGFIEQLKKDNLGWYAFLRVVYNILSYFLNIYIYFFDSYRVNNLSISKIQTQTEFSVCRTIPSKSTLTLLVQGCQRRASKDFEELRTTIVACSWKSKIRIVVC